jgi:cytochrome c oxidase subunit 1
VAGLVIIPIYLIHSLKKGRPAPPNPWAGATLEWKTSSPPPWDNFKRPPEVTDPYDFDNLEYDEKSQGYVTAK